MGKFTVIPQNTFDGLQLDAGVLLKKFDPSNPAPPSDEDIVCATTGGVNPTCVPTFSDLGEDVDNVPLNMKELKHLDSWECKLSTTCLGTTAEAIKLSLGCADIDTETSRIIPRGTLSQKDFTDLWWVGDKADGGFVAIQIKNALSTGGFSLQTTKNGKGTIGLEITGHVSIKAQKTVPMVFYSAEGGAFTWLTVSPEADNVKIFGTKVSDLQENVILDGDTFKGTLKYYDDAESELVQYWGAGNFLALNFSDIDEAATSVKVGLRPTYPRGGSAPVDDDTGLVEIINDPDKNGVFLIHDKDTQKFKVVISNGTDTTTQLYDLSGLTLEDEGV